ncbi:hypothetical protein ACOYW6_03505 [Parablastomonas sp. CN1-191]|uniref:hypothetical protein n=1 Tax=Parablastomonas sp. CN1-191 TaxID=3400908 RepID=UPI003BF858DB
MAAPLVDTGAAVFVERAIGGTRTLAPADRLSPGDRVVYIVNWQRKAGAGSFIVTNPLPRAVNYQASADGTEEVSVDGGRTWGKLDALRVGSRRALPEDVTHVRWRIAAPARSGSLAFSGIVR